MKDYKCLQELLPNHTPEERIHIAKVVSMPPIPKLNQTRQDAQKEREFKVFALTDGLSKTVMELFALICQEELINQKVSTKEHINLKDMDDLPRV